MTIIKTLESNPNKKSHMETQRSLLIVIADDDDGHAELIIDSLEQSGITDKIIRFENGDKTWHFIENQALNYIQNGNIRVLVLLDIKMPGLNGIEVLKRIKSHENLKTIPVVMLTTTDDPVEIEECYRIGCNVYITKPVDFDLFSEKLNRLGLFIQSIKI